MFKTACEVRDRRTNVAHSLDEIDKVLKENQGYVKTMWCGDEECEEKIKEKTGAKSRCIPFEQENLGDKCAICGKPAKCMVVWGRQY